MRRHSERRGKLRGIPSHADHPVRAFAWDESRKFGATVHLASNVMPRVYDHVPHKARKATSLKDPAGNLIRTWKETLKASTIPAGLANYASRLAGHRLHLS